MPSAHQPMFGMQINVQIDPLWRNLFNNKKNTGVCDRVITDLVRTLLTFGYFLSTLRTICRKIETIF